MNCTDGSIQVALVSSKVAPIKKLTIPCLELCGSHLLSQIHHIGQAFDIPSFWSYARTDSIIMLGWLAGNPRLLKTYVCNRVSSIVELLESDRGKLSYCIGRRNPCHFSRLILYIFSPKARDSLDFVIRSKYSIQEYEVADRFFTISPCSGVM